MTVDDKTKQDRSRIKLSWRERLVVPMLLAGGLLTLTWIVVLIAAALQIVSAIAGVGRSG